MQPKMNKKEKIAFIKTQYGRGKRYANFAELYEDFQCISEIPLTCQFLGFVFEDIKSILEKMHNSKGLYKKLK